MQHRPPPRRRPVGDHHPRHVHREEAGRPELGARRRRPARPGRAASTGYSDALVRRARVSTSAPAHPTATPTARPPTRLPDAEDDPVGRVGWPSHAARSPTVSRTAIGSLAPDSTSRRLPSRRGMRTRRSAENTAAASVDATTAPTSSAVVPSTSRSSAAADRDHAAGDEDPDGREATAPAPRSARTSRQPDAEPALVEDDHERGHGEPWVSSASDRLTSSRPSSPMAMPARGTATGRAPGSARRCRHRSPPPAAEPRRPAPGGRADLVVHAGVSLRR